jgi:trk system potassium uptake protein
MRILIIGAGKTGTYLAERLTPHHVVTVIELRPESADRIRRMVPEATVIMGDACEPSVLERAGVRDVDLVAAVTGDDEDNLVVAMLAKLYDAKAIYGRVNHPRNEWLFDKEWGVDVAVSSPQVIYGLIEKDVGFGDLITLLKLKAEGVYLEEITLPANSTKLTRKLEEIGLPANVTVMAILAADGYIQAPRGETPLVAGDQMLLLVQGELDEGVIQEAFGIPSNAEQPADGA